MKTLVKECGSCYVPEALPSGGQRARSSAGEHHVDIVGVAGSIPVVPTTACFCKGRLRKGTGGERRHTSRCSLQTRACGFGLLMLRMFRYSSYMNLSYMTLDYSLSAEMALSKRTCCFPLLTAPSVRSACDEFRDALQGTRNISNDDRGQPSRWRSRRFSPCASFAEYAHTQGRIAQRKSTTSTSWDRWFDPSRAHHRLLLQRTTPEGHGRRETSYLTLLLANACLWVRPPDAAHVSLFVVHEFVVHDARLFPVGGDGVGQAYMLFSSAHGSLRSECVRRVPRRSARYSQYLKRRSRTAITLEKSSL